MNKKLKAITVIVTALLTGCAGYSPPKDIIGQHRDVLIAQMGPPERELVSEDYKVLHYPRGPAGSHTYFIYTDDNDRVVRWEQVLKEELFDKIKPGMTSEEVMRIVGITKITNMLGRNRGYVWHYRYESPFRCKSFVIEFTLEDVVRSAGYRLRSGRRCTYVGSG